MLFWYCQWRMVYSPPDVSGINPRQWATGKLSNNMSLADITIDNNMLYGSLIFFIMSGVWKDALGFHNIKTVQSKQGFLFGHYY